MRTLLASLAFATLAIGCSGSPEQVVTGRVSAGFPTTVTAVRAVQNGRVLSTSQVAADGSFRLAFAAGPHVALQLVGAGKTQVVFPRHTGGILTTVSVRANGAPFDLGAITYVGDASSATIAFHDGPTAEAECENGHDSTGAVCVDDEDSDHGTCDSGDDGDGEHEGEHHDGDGDHAGEADDDVDDSLADQGDAVAEHNFPADGCSDDESGESEGSGGGDD